MTLLACIGQWVSFGQNLNHSEWVHIMWFRPDLGLNQWVNQQVLYACLCQRIQENTAPGHLQ